MQHDLWTQSASYASEGVQEVQDGLPEPQDDWLGTLTEGKATSFPVRIPGLSFLPESRRQFSTSARHYARIRPEPGSTESNLPIKFPAHPNPSP